MYLLVGAVTYFVCVRVCDCFNAFEADLLVSSIQCIGKGSISAFLKLLWSIALQCPALKVYSNMCCSLILNYTYYNIV